MQRLAHRRHAAGAAVTVVVALVAVGCAGGGAPGDDLHALPQPVIIYSAPGNLAPDAPDGVVPLPKHDLTPGQVASTDLAAICRLPKEVHRKISHTIKERVYSSYGLRFPNPNYDLNRLVPLALGGASTAANLWPIPVSNFLYHDKSQLDERLHILVCAGELPLAQADTDETTDWYLAWIRYVGND